MKTIITHDTAPRSAGVCLPGQRANARAAMLLICCCVLPIFAADLRAAEKISTSIWDLNTGKRIQTFFGHNRPVTTVAFSPDGSNILTGSVTSELRLWDAVTGKQIQAFQGYGSTAALAFLQHEL